MLSARVFLQTKESSYSLHSQGGCNHFVGSRRGLSIHNGLGTEALKRMTQRPEHLLFPSSPCHTRGMISPFLSLQFSGVICVPSFAFTSHVIMCKVSLLCLDVSGVMRIAQFLPHTAILRIRLGNSHKGPCNVPGNSQNHGCKCYDSRPLT